MYIAFKWLFGLSLAMWIAMCSIDFIVKRNTEIAGEGFHVRPLVLSNIKNRSASFKSKWNFHTPRFLQRLSDKQTSMAYLHCVMFAAGALVVIIYSRINEIVSITKREIASVFTSTNAKRLQEYSKITATEANKIAIIFSKKMWENFKRIVWKSINTIRVLTMKSKQIPKVNTLLLNKLKELGEERKNLTHLLMAAIQENKNIRMQYQLELMAKNRLVKHIENTQKVIKENRSKYVSFQQLYLVTHQENIFLKLRLKKLTQEKEEVSKNLLELMNEIYKSKNNELKAYCCRFIVKTKDNLLNVDVGTEINMFLKRKSRDLETTNLNCRPMPNCPVIELNTTNSWLRCSSFTQISTDNDSILALVNEAPKLRGLPGEYVWTVKDKDGLIEKLYEYDCESEFENGDTIRRIRKYSVYFDKDCLLDFSNSSTIVNEIRRPCPSSMSSHTNVGFPVANQRFLTGSEAFQKFMQNNKNVVSSAILPVSQPLH